MQSYVERFIGGDLSVLPHILIAVEGKRTSSSDTWDARLYHQLVKMLVIVGPRVSLGEEGGARDESQVEHYVLALRILNAAISCGGDVAKEARKSLLEAGLCGCRAMNLDSYFSVQSWMISHVVRFVAMLAIIYRVEISEILTVSENIQLTERESRALLPHLLAPSGRSSVNTGLPNLFATSSSPTTTTTSTTTAAASTSASNGGVTRGWRDIPKQPSFVPLPHNPFHVANSDASMWMHPQFPTPIIAFAKQFGEGCTAKLPKLSASLISVALTDAKSAEEQELPHESSLPLASRHLKAALDFEQQRDSLFVRYLSSGLLLAWGAESAIRGDGQRSTSFCAELEAGSSETYILSPIILTFPVSVVAVVCGAHSCYFVTVDNRVYSCGMNDWGQLGSGGCSASHSAVRSDTKDGKGDFDRVILRQEDKVAKIGAGSAFATAVIRHSNRLCLWGQNTYGQCLMPGSKVIPKPVEVDIPSHCGRITEIACGSFFAAVVFSSGAMGTWGLFSMLGISVPPEQLRETETENRTKCAKTISVFKPNCGRIVALRAGPWHCLAITSTGAVYSWGADRNGRLGHGEGQGGKKMRRIESLTNYVVIDASCGSFHSAVLTKEGLLFVFGENTCSQLGLRGNGPRHTAEPLPLPKRAIAVSCGREHTCVLLEDGDVVACGTLRSCGIGLGIGARFSIPRRSLQNYVILSLSSGATHAVAAGLTRSVSLQQVRLPTKLLPKKSLKWINRVVQRHGVTAVAAGRGFIVVVMETGDAFAIGQSERGQLGTGEVSIAEGTKFYRVSLPHGVRLCAVDCGFNYTIGIDTSGALYSWGWNSHGQLGHGDSVPLCDSVFTPREVMALQSVQVVQVACGGTFAMALTQDGEVYTWGESLYCGHHCSNTLHLMKPVLLEELREIVAVAAGVSHAVAISCDHVIYTWGTGTLGNGETVRSVVRTPMVVTFAHSVRQIGCGPFNTFVVTDVGDLFVWGSNENAQCGMRHQAGGEAPPAESDPHTEEQQRGHREKKTCSVVPFPTFVASNVRDAAFSASCGFIIKEDGVGAISGRCCLNGREVVVPSFTPQRSPLSSRGKCDHGGASSQGFFLRCFCGYDDLIVLLEWGRPSAAAVSAAVANLRACLQSTGC